MAAQSKVDDLWKSSKEMVVLVHAAAAEPTDAAVTYLLALC